MSNKIDYVNERLPVKQLVPLGLQHVLSMYAGALVVPIVLGGALGLSPQQLAYLIAADLFTCGIATLIQAYGIGNYAGIKLPTILGCSFVAVGPMIAIGTAANVSSGVQGLTIIYGATIISGLLLWAVSGLFGKLTRFFPPVVTGTVITVVGLSLIPLALDNAAGGANNADYGDPKNLLLAVFVLGVVIFMNRFFKGFLQSISVLVGLLAGTIVAYFLGMVNFEEIRHAGWFELILPFHFGMPEFRLDAIISLTLVAIVTSVEAIGVFLGLGEICDKEISEKDIIKGLRAEGIAKTMGGLFNSFPYATFSQNVGLVTLSGVKSRFVCVAAGFILIVLGVIPKFAALGTAIPMSVLGGATLAMFGMVAVSGIRILSGVDFSKQGNLIIIAVSIAIGLGCKVSQGALANLPDGLKMIFQDGIISASLFAIVLNILFNFKDIKKSSTEGSSEAVAE
ncbi:xanthine permease PbuX [Gottschalkia acidurici 9a]|uniref:Xanthine permease PbuX n=1 Tax=Gottschalkia acidurici (strain ATCC 7906 / DSM 604 / BCRC 14475 / CIP 104303 / KCTC 5404 / NCIMB 10678 / 9a) TaxID=1128398 RepID=K0B116_GOTA9|nr:solute carrier family 23 protein [Gottschalkia acidurici]AFS79713.1 xanthine permease PbuX [Gottschalkia acidurici 9a]